MADTRSPAPSSADPVLTPSDGTPLLVAGSIAFDQIMDFGGYFKDHVLPDKLHMINLSFLVQELKRQHGGCSANMGYSLALLGEKPTLLAATGHDFDDYREHLEGLGIDLSEVRQVEDLVTACCFITTDKANNQITGFYPGAMGAARELSLAAAVGRVAPEWVMVAPDDPEAMRRHCREAKEAGVKLLYDPSFQVIAFDGDVLEETARDAWAVFTNDYEFAVYQKKTGRDEEGLLELAPRWVVTLGEQGSKILRRDGEPIEIPAAEPESVADPTGAGDAYRAGFLAGLARGLDLAVCGRMGSVAAVYAVERYGTQAHRYTRQEFAERYRANFGDA